jgi:hypothetical protein
LRAQGATSLPEPSCAVCARLGQPLTRSSTGGVCARCRRRELAEGCARCGVIKPVAGRDSQRRPVCARCSDRPQRQCGRCGRISSDRLTRPGRGARHLRPVFPATRGHLLEAAAAAGPAVSPARTPWSAPGARRGAPSPAPVAARTSHPWRTGPKVRSATPATPPRCAIVAPAAAA